MSANEAGELSDEAMIWRYMTFERMSAVLEHNSLWFARPFTFPDSWEGLYPPSYYRNARKWAVDNNEQWDEYEEDFTRRWKHYRYATFVNCWQIGNHESDVMWRLYADGNGIAIQSSVGRVQAYLPIDNCGRVRYYDPEKGVGDKSITAQPDILHKRISFRDENEFRVWVVDDELAERIQRNEEFGEEELSSGKPVAIRDMGQLIEKMVVAPGGNIDLVKDLCSHHNKSWLTRRVEQSYLDRLHPAFMQFRKQFRESKQ